MLSKAVINIVVNACSFLGFICLVSTGLLLKFVLPPGSGRVETLARGGREKAIDLCLGLTRHQWGEIHFYISLGFLTLLATHLVLHWPWIRAVAWGTAQRPLPLRRRMITVGVVLLALAALSTPWVLPKEKMGRAEYRAARGR
jgi:hypothetical protein